MTTTCEPMPQTEVMYRTIFFVVEEFGDVSTVFKIIDDYPHRLRQGSCTGKGLSSVTILSTTGEAAEVVRDSWRNRRIATLAAQLMDFLSSSSDRLSAYPCSASYSAFGIATYLVFSRLG